MILADFLRQIIRAGLRIKFQLGEVFNHSESKFALNEIRGGQVEEIRRAQNFGTVKDNFRNRIVFNPVEKKLNVRRRALIEIHGAGKDIESCGARFVHLVVRQAERHFHQVTELRFDFDNLNSSDGKNFNALLAEPLNQSFFGVVVTFQIAADNVNAIRGD